MSPLENNILITLLVFCGAATVVALFMSLSAFIGPKRKSEVKDMPFECGWLIPSDATQPFPIKYYLVAILFIVFDIEVAFMYPWAVSFGAVGIVGFISMMMFLVILLVGLYYAIKKNVFEWK